MRPRPLSLTAVLAAALVLVSCGGRAVGTTATIAMHYSQFDPALITATAGEPLAITLRNDDPIEHEWIVGDEETHQRHRTGTEPFHATIPTEVTLPPYSTRVTTVSFEEPGEYLYICHLPGHEQYGMVGTIRVVDGNSSG